jgi:hypothetical protein
MIYVGVNYQDTIQICSFPPLACDQQRLSQPFLFDFDVLIFLKFRELFSWFLISEKWDGSSVFGEREDAVVS